MKYSCIYIPACTLYRRIQKTRWKLKTFIIQTTQYGSITLWRSCVHPLAWHPDQSYITWRSLEPAQRSPLRPQMWQHGKTLLPSQQIGRDKISWTAVPTGTEIHSRSSLWHLHDLAWSRQRPTLRKERNTLHTNRLKCAPEPVWQYGGSVHLNLHMYLTQETTVRTQLMFVIEPVWPLLQHHGSV